MNEQEHNQKMELNIESKGGNKNNVRKKETAKKD